MYINRVSAIKTKKQLNCKYIAAASEEIMFRGWIGKPTDMYKNGT